MSSSQQPDQPHMTEMPSASKDLSSRTDKLELLDGRGTASLSLPRKTSRPHLQSRPTTALSLADAQPETRQHDGSPRSTIRTMSRKPSHAHINRVASEGASEAGETSSLRSFAPSMDRRSESLLGDVNAHIATPAWKALSAQLEIDDPFDRLFVEDDIFSARFDQEFDEIGDINPEGTNEEFLYNEWRGKLKQFFIFSSSGKPIWSRHGGDQLISGLVGVMQTLISYYQGSSDQLRSFTAGDTRFVVVSKGHLHLFAISKLDESVTQLQSQLDALYMQILSTLTLPSMERMFLNRPSTDLRRPLQGTEVLLDALADGFSRGSPSTLLSALECLKLRKLDRQNINAALLKVRTPNLLYGLVVADARLVSVIRPKKHSLHPGDLHLIFNMLFEAGSVKAGGGENWIPLCLPSFNNTGYLYMYVSFVDAAEAGKLDSSKSPLAPGGGSLVAPTTTPLSPLPTPGGAQPHASSGAAAAAASATTHKNEMAIVLISASKEAFFELRGMRDALLSQLQSNSSLSAIRTSMAHGRPQLSSIIPTSSSSASTAGGNSNIPSTTSAIRHFLYKSRGNVQYVQPSFAPHFAAPVARRRLVSLYEELSSALHGRTAKAKVVHWVGRDASALAWETPLFELHVVARAGTGKEVLAAAANRIVAWVRREEERVFIIGGATW